MKKPGAFVILRSNIGRILLIKGNRSDKNPYELPGGGLEIGELPGEIAARELEEETAGAYVLRSDELSFIGFGALQKTFGFVTLFTNKKPVHEHMIPVGPETSASLWITPGEALGLSDIYPAQRVLVAMYYAWSVSDQKTIVEERLSAPHANSVVAAVIAKIAPK